MNFLEIEESIKTKNHDMSRPHSHDHYELYFLLEGEREFFLDNQMFVIPKNTFIVVPPYSMHKTEGGPFNRVNINVSPDLLSEYEINFLRKISKFFATQLDKNYLSIITRLLKEGVEIQLQSSVNKKETLLTITKSIILLLSRQEIKPLKKASEGTTSPKAPTHTLKVVYYINTHFTENLTLKTICDKFYLSKMTLCKQFKATMNCSIMKYITNLRINKAKELLINSNKSIEEISEICGFSSANYFGLAFKKETGVSPFNYKKQK